MAPVSSTDPQVLSNDLTIIFGVLATLIAVVGVVIGVYQFRHSLRTHTTDSNDLEMYNLRTYQIHNNVRNTAKPSDAFKNNTSKVNLGNSTSECQVDMTYDLPSCLLPPTYQASQRM